MARQEFFRLFFRHLVLLLIVCLHPCECKKGTRITSLYACTDIKYRFATTRITSHVINPTNQSRQAVFDITLPNDAFISNFTLTVDGLTYPGRVEERGEALRRYGSNSTQDDVSSGRVTQRPRETNQFRVTLKVAPFQGVTFNLTYQEILERRLGFYDHVLYIDPGQPVEDLRVDVSIEENRPISYLHVPPIRSDLLTDFDISETNSLVRVERPSGRHAYISYHPSAQQQQVQGMSQDGLSGLFTVRYDVGRSLDAGELLSVNGYFVHFIAPTVQQSIPKDVLFILDTSTSMKWQKLGQLQDAMRVILNDLAPEDRFALMQFNSRATFWRRQLLPVTSRTIQWAMQYVNSLKARGYTNIDSALAQGLQFFNEDPTVKGNTSLIIFLTDGRPTRGETDQNKILRHVRAQNRKNVTVFGLAFGKDADWPLVKKLASQNYGVGRRIYQDADAALQIHGFYDEVSTLLLTGVQASYLDSQVDLETLTRTLFRKFFNGSEMVVAGKLIRLNQTALQVLVQATGRKGQVNLTIVPDPDPTTPGEVKSCGLLRAEELAGVVEKMWAYLTIGQLLRQRVGEDDPATKRQLKQKATELALAYNFVTPMTSLVVSKPGEEELAFLQEDASDLLDESDTWLIDDYLTTLPPSTTTPKTTTLISTTISTTTTTTTLPPQTVHDSTSSNADSSVSQSSATVSPTTQTSLLNLTASTDPDLPPENTSVSLPLRTASSPEVPTTPQDSGLSRGTTITRSTPEENPVFPKNSTAPELRPEASTTTATLPSPTGPVLPQASSQHPSDPDSAPSNATYSKRPVSPPDSSTETTDTIRPVGSTAVPDGGWEPEDSASTMPTSAPELSTPGVSKGTAAPPPRDESSSRRGGGGGDPHFMVEMTSLSYPLCYDITGDTGDVFRLLRDPQSGLTVNVEISRGRRKPPGSSRFPVYITKVAILLQDVVAEVTAAHARVNEATLRWDTMGSVYLPGVWVMMNNSTLRFALDWGAEVDVTRHVRHGTNQRAAASFLNVEIQNEAQLSKQSTGLLGQFVHKDVRLQRIKKRDGRLVAELEISDNRGGHPHVRHGRALLKNRKDPYFRRQASCLMVDSLWSHVLDKPTRLYKVRSLYYI
ncbi:inter-alpha-trypsin inhibitor heavy chain H4-like [Babylonia areolata]|uniref:inter-alpha-trypsin inhibitor heavy chain H4-like n=1 Tax=Babylonia areolata TaxID=304850 RepID=UPI003FD027A6